MAYQAIVNMATDHDLLYRCVAASAAEGRPDPVEWGIENIWHLCASPGWDSAWESAEAGEVENIGRNPGVITDGMILAAVQARLGA